MAAAGAVNGMTQDVIIHWMKMIPTKYITHNTRIDLSITLDPPRPLPDSDYRSFADRSGLLPEKVEWLNSQKIEGKTSSICLILDYLQQTRTSYTVYDVYKTLCDMQSAAQVVIWRAMPEIIRKFNAGTRPGQENTEPPSLNPPAPGSRSPPPPYRFSDGPEGSTNIATNFSGHPLNDLGGPCVPPGNSTAVWQIPYSGPNAFIEREPGENSFHGHDPPPFPGPWLSMPGESSFLPVPNPGNVPGREPDENSCSLADEPAGSCACGGRSAVSSNYMPSQVQPHSGFPTQASPTDMMELKPALNGPVVEVRDVPQDVTHQFQSSQRASYPVSRFPSYKTSASTSSSRPVSDGRFSSDEQTVVKLKLNQRNSVMQNTQLSNAASDLNKNGSFRIDQQTLPKQPLDSIAQAERGNITPMPSDKRGDSGCHSLPVTSPAHAGSWQFKQHQSENVISSAPAMFQQLQRHQAMSSQRQSDYFVFILAADIEETSQLSQQVVSLTQELKNREIPHVAVTSTFAAPITYLPPHLISRMSTQTNGNAHANLSIPDCFRKAAKVLMMVSPGYKRYADKYSGGAAKDVTSRQKLIRGFHDELKDEFFNNKDRLRVWPVLHLKARPDHMPSFLQDSIYYFYPPEPASEDLLALLKCEWAKYKG